MKIEKYHGCGNDFLIVEGNGKNGERWARKLCDRHFSFGADGLIFIHRRRIRFFNPDGSESSLCGNGLRCAAFYLYRKGEITERTVLKTDSGKYKIKCLSEDPFSVRVLFPLKDFPPVEEIYMNNQKVHLIDLGNKHAVFFVREFPDVQEAETIASCPPLNSEYNLNFIKILKPDLVKIKTYERGVGFTLSCGSGSVASALVLYRKGLCGKMIRFDVPYGSLSVLIEDGIYLQGSAEFVYESEVDENGL